jgi:hypothetical protein
MNKNNLNELLSEYKELSKNSPKAHIKKPGEKIMINHINSIEMNRMFYVSNELLKYENKLDFNQEEIFDLKMRAGKLK